MRRLDEKGLKLDGARNESHEDLCAHCEEPGELICCEGRCARVFHRSCLPPNNDGSDESARWVCSDCRSKRFRCFFCKRWGAERYDVHRCGKRACGKSYHVECLLASLEPFGVTLPPFPCATPKSDAAKCAPCKPTSGGVSEAVATPQPEVVEVIEVDDDDDDDDEVLDAP